MKLRRLFLFVTALICLSGQGVAAAQSKAGLANAKANKEPPPAKRQTENYRDLIEKARNLTLQRDRLQASQILQQALKKEIKNTNARRELLRAIEDLTGVFYTEKGQSLYAQADAIVETRTREAIDSYAAALRAEDGNVSILKALARAHLILAECDKAGDFVNQAEALNPVSPEVRLLKIQVADCSNQFEQVSRLLVASDVDLSSVASFMRPLELKDLVRKNDLKKAKSLMTAWEANSPDYPEVFYWKWKLSSLQGQAERASALKYSLLCQNLTPRKKKNFILDLELCKGKEKVEEYLKTTGMDDAASAAE